MSENREIMNFIVPWVGGMIASWGDISPVGVLWAIAVCYASVRMHEFTLQTHKHKG